MEYSVLRRFEEHKGYSGWVWVLCILLFTPLVIVLIVGHYTTEKIEKVEVQYRQKGGWLYSKKVMTLQEFNEWKKSL